MLKCMLDHEDALDAALAALSDGTRRAVVRRLTAGAGLGG